MEPSRTFKFQDLQLYIQLLAILEIPHLKGQKCGSLEFEYEAVHLGYDITFLKIAILFCKVVCQLGHTYVQVKYLLRTGGTLLSSFPITDSEMHHCWQKQYHLETGAPLRI